MPFLSVTVKQSTSDNFISGQSALPPPLPLPSPLPPTNPLPPPPQLPLILLSDPFRHIAISVQWPHILSLYVHIYAVHCEKNILNIPLNMSKNVMNLITLSNTTIKISYLEGLVENIFSFF